MPADLSRDRLRAIGPRRDAPVGRSSGRRVGGLRARSPHAWIAVFAASWLVAMSPTTFADDAAAAEIQKLLADGRNAEALKRIDESLAKNPGDASMRFRKGVALSMLDRRSDALAVFQKLVDDHPDMPAPYNNMAVIYGAQGDYDKARWALERAIRTNPAYATAYQNLGDVYAQLASQAYSKALQLDKGNGSVPPKLALLRELTGTKEGEVTRVADAHGMDGRPSDVRVGDARPAGAASAPVLAPSKALMPTAPTAPAPTAATVVPPANVAVGAAASGATRPMPPPALPARAASTTAVAEAGKPAPAPSTLAAASAASFPPAASAKASASAPATKSAAPDSMRSSVSNLAAAAPSASSAPSPALAADSPQASGKATAKASDAAVGEVESAVQAWAAAWSRRDMAAYFAAYAPEFSGQQTSRRAWEQERRDRIAARKQIKVEISQLQVQASADRAEARFRQSYASDSLTTNGRKTLELVRAPSGKWLIRRESVGG